MGKMIEYIYPLNLLEEFSNAIDVIKYINKNEFDLSFLDIHVPDFLETTKILSKSYW
jgi:two-component system response regulator LytT